MYLFTVVLISLTLFSALNFNIELLFNIVSTFAVPPISFIFPFLLYKELIETDYFGKEKDKHRIYYYLAMIISVGVWLVSIVSLFYTKVYNVQ
jgi:amino acid permease